MSKSASIADYINEFGVIVSRLSSVEMDFDDEVCALIILSSLLNIWNNTVTTVSNFSRSTSLKFDRIRDLIMTKDIRRRESGESIYVALVGDRGRSRICVSRSSTNMNGHSQSRTSDAIYWSCGKRGYLRNNCFKPKNDKGKKIMVDFIE